MQTTIPLLPEKYYHIYNRGNNSETIFKEEKNYVYFLSLYSKYICPIVDTFVYCLLSNHFHFLIRIKKIEDIIITSQVLKTCEVSKVSKYLSQQFSNFFNAYTKAINKGYIRTGRLFQERFRKIEVNSDEYFKQLIRYIHFNPEKHGLINDFKQYRYSSYNILLTDKPTHLNRSELLNWFIDKEDFIKFHYTNQNNIRSEKIIGEDPD
ncbi:MAG: hypothetical protein JXJ22_02145 [Bacteroidales bacterium]|nr:hypothetical protein [Bacteroidales bacterium]